MGREVRMIKPGWEHPTDGTYANGETRYNPLLGVPGYEKAAAHWDACNALWEQGLMDDWSPGEDIYSIAPRSKPKSDYALEFDTYAEWSGERPIPEDYMPTWVEGEATMYVMYEDTSEGTPISPPFADPYELAQWLANTGASSFGGCTSSYENWLSMILGSGYSVGMVMDADGIRSGVGYGETPQATNNTRIKDLIEQRKEFATLIDNIDNDPNVYSYAEECVLQDKKTDAAISYYNLSKEIEELEVK